MGILSKLFHATSEPKWYKVFDSLQEAEKNVAMRKAVTVMIEDKKICLARTATGFYAVDLACPHLGMELSKGVCNSMDEIVCPWHAWRFSLKTGHETSGQGSGSGIAIYRVKVNESGLYIGI